MGKYVFILVIGCFSSAFATSTEIEFKNSSIFFSASKTATELQFSDSLGLRNLKIKPCNRKIINKFWSNLEKSVSTLQFSKASKGRVPSSDAWVKYEGIKLSVLNFEPALRFFNQVPNESLLLFVESKKLCDKK